MVRERQVIPLRVHVLPYARMGAFGRIAVSPAQVGLARPAGAISRPVQSNSHFRRGAGFRPVRTSQRRLAGLGVYAQPMFFEGGGKELPLGLAAGAANATARTRP